jgi:hypothetical protein
MSAPIQDYIIAEDFSRTTSCTADEWKILKLVEYWQFFLTLTFVNLGNVRGRINRVRTWLRWVARQGNTHPNYLVYVIRWERGEIGDRPHCHMFLGGMKDVKNYISMAHILEHDWRKHHGLAAVRPFERSRIGNGANYLAGFRNDWDWDKNLYEIRKFGRVDFSNIYFSRHAEEILHQMRNGPAAA